MNKFTSLFLALGVVSLGACNNDDDAKPANNMVNVSATIDGKQEVPANSSAATGMMTGTYDKTTRVLTYNVTYQGLTPVAGHIHRGLPTGTGPVVVPFSDVSKSPITGTTAPLRASFADSLMAGQAYVNLHTPAYPNGEIRGNITVK